MGNFAKVLNGIVQQVIVAEPEFFDTFVDSSPGNWLQTSYNTRGGVHYGQDGQPDGGVALRANYAGVGYTYDHEHDVFYAAQPFPSWTICAPAWIWQAPVEQPTDGKNYKWDEITLSWLELN
jgi:hypothetical protein